MFKVKYLTKNRTSKNGITDVLRAIWHCNKKTTAETVVDLYDYFYSIIAFFACCSSLIVAFYVFQCCVVVKDTE